MEQVSFLMEPRAAEYSSSGDSLEAIVLKTRHELISRPALHPPVRLPFYNGSKRACDKHIMAYISDTSWQALLFVIFVSLFFVDCN